MTESSTVSPSLDDTQPVRVDDTGQHPVSPVPVIEIEGVHKIYRTGALEVAALRGVSLTISAGEYVAPRTPQEEVLAGLFAEVLGVKLVVPKKTAL